MCPHCGHVLHMPRTQERALDTHSCARDLPPQKPNTRGYKVLSFGIVLKHMKSGILIGFVYKFPLILLPTSRLPGKALHRVIHQDHSIQLFSSKHLCSCLPLCTNTFTHILLKFTHFGKYEHISSLKCEIWVSHILKSSEG